MASGESQKMFKISESVDTILCDIEGTTTSISFVKDFLFPFVRTSLADYLRENFEGVECQEDIKLLIEQYEEDLKTFGESNVPKIVKLQENNKIEFIDSLVSNIFWQMDQDRKAKPLKQLQGHIWKKGYAKGLIKGQYVD